MIYLKRAALAVFVFFTFFFLLMPGWAKEDEGIRKERTALIWQNEELSDRLFRLSVQASRSCMYWRAQSTRPDSERHSTLEIATLINMNEAGGCNAEIFLNHRAVLRQCGLKLKLWCEGLKILDIQIVKGPYGEDL